MVIHVINILLFCVATYLVLYYIWGFPILRIHKLQSKEWITNLTDHLVLGVNRPELLPIYDDVPGRIDYWYCYWHFHTKQYTGYVLFNRQNKFSKNLVLNFYYYDFDNKMKARDRIVLSFDDLKTSKDADGSLVIRCGEAYYQQINMEKNIMVLRLNMGTLDLTLRCKITDYTTNQPSFIARYRMINSIVRTGGNATRTPGEWMSDNPMIGKVMGGTLNNQKIEAGGNFWFDNFIGTNNYYLYPYIWFVTITDDWLVYLLWFGDQKDQGKYGIVKPVLIKDIKNDRVLFAGMNGCVPPVFEGIHSVVQPYKMEYVSRSSLKSDTYDDYEVSFDSPEFSYKCKSVPGESVCVMRYNYYDSGDLENSDKLSPWDKKYYHTIRNIGYVEYVTQVDIEIKYMGEIQRFRARQVIDGKYRKDESIPEEIHLV